MYGLLESDKLERTRGIVVWQVYSPVIIIIGPKWKEFRGEKLNISQCKLRPKKLQLVILDTSELVKCKWTTAMILGRNMEASAYPQYVWWSSLPPLIPLSAHAWSKQTLYSSNLQLNQEVAFCSMLISQQYVLLNWHTYWTFSFVSFLVKYSRSSLSFYYKVKVWNLVCWIQ